MPNKATVERKNRIVDAALQASEWLGDTTGLSNREFLMLVRDCPHLPSAQRQKAAEKLIEFEEAKIKAVAHIDASDVPEFVIRDCERELVTHQPAQPVIDAVLVESEDQSLAELSTK